MIDVKQLRYFRTIVEQGSFSRAAQNLHVAQPALSLHVRNMEENLDTVLLHRTPRGVSPTEAGMILLRHARIILDQLTVAEEEVRAQQHTPTGEVRLGMPGTIGQIAAVPLITAAYKQYPKVKLRIAEAMSGFILEWLKEDRIDLAVLYRQAKGQGITTELLLTENLQFIGPAKTAKNEAFPLPGTEIMLSALANTPLILPGQAHGLRQLINHYADIAEIKLDSVIDVDSYSNIKSLVAANIGYSILPENAVAAEVADGRLRQWKISGPASTRNIYIAYSTGKPMTGANTAMLALLRETLRDLVRSNRWVGAYLTEDQPPGLPPELADEAPDRKD